MRILVLNNYDLDRVSGEVARGEKPAHHLFGLAEWRRAGWQIEVVPQHLGPRWLKRWVRWLGVGRWPVPLGDIAQQWTAWRHRSAADAIYAPCQTQTQLLAYLRAFGILKLPLVTVAHHPPVVGRLAGWRRGWFRLQGRGTDCFPALSAAVAREIMEKGGRGIRAPVVNWGPDLAYYARHRIDAPGNGVVAAGRTGRDWLTFGRGATLAGTDARIICLAADVRPEFAGFGSNVRVETAAAESDFPYPRLTPVLAAARVLAVPLTVGPWLSGLTSVTDALGLGKPLIVTKHPLIDIEVEAEGIGRWVEPGDAAGWARALEWFDRNPGEAHAMGRRALALAESRWNSARFAAEMASWIEVSVERSRG